jgi:hypothetical protein
MIMAGNTAFVAAAMVIDLYPDDVAGEARGIRMAFLCNALMALLGLVIAVLLLKRLSREDRDRLASVTERDPV